MADQEFLASFGVEIDESGLDRLQKALKENRTLAEQLASAFDSARNAVAEFFNQLSASTLPSGELSPWQRLAKLSEGGLVLRPVWILRRRRMRCSAFRTWRLPWSFR